MSRHLRRHHSFVRRIIELREQHLLALELLASLGRDGAVSELRLQLADTRSHRLRLHRLDLRLVRLGLRLCLQLKHILRAAAAALAPDR